MGPLTYLSWSRTSDGSNALDHLEAVAQQYAELIGVLKQRGTTCVQFDEPALVTDVDPDLLPRVRAVYQELVSHGVPLIVTTYFGDATVCVETLSGIGLAGFGVDLVTAPGALPAWTGEETLIAGIVDGRNVWRTNLDQALSTLQELRTRGPVAVSTSCSLLHVPYTIAGEDFDLADFAASRAAAALRKKVQATALNLPPLPTTTIGSFPQTPQIRQARPTTQQ
ncbi:5-methyltetrahydropteroyltriglutamate--homocysteine methyltransferase [Corynebacterium belfantii]|nr:5-methyltetrahydropteroyltriglutamate--homocysteine methyltransferase [Corynebacterium belfantii]